MSYPWNQRVLIGSLIAVLMLVTCAKAVSAQQMCMTGAANGQLGARQIPGAMDSLPKLFVWAWEREEDLRWINPAKVGVAYLAETLMIKSDGLHSRLRTQSLQVPEGTRMVAVVRIDVATDAQLQLTTSLSETLAAKISRFCRFKNVDAIQIDFDARQRERAFYVDLLQQLRKHMPQNCALSITALSSWCACDNWMSRLPADEIVPMMFSFGPQKMQMVQWLEKGNKFTHPLCQRSLGISINEPEVNKRIFPLTVYKATADRMRVYVFSSKPWSQNEFETIRREIANE